MQRHASMALHFPCARLVHQKMPPPKHDKHSLCTKKPLDDKLQEALQSVPGKKEYKKQWLHALPAQEEPEECATCKQWRYEFAQHTATLFPKYVWEVDELPRCQKRLERVLKRGNHAYLSQLIHVDEEDPEPAAAVIAAPVTSFSLANSRYSRWFEKGGETKSARAKTYVVQNLCCLMLCCGCMPVIGLIEGILLFPAGALFGVVLSSVIASGMAMRAFQYFFYYSELGVGYKIVYAWVPFVYVIGVVPVTFIGSLIFGLVSSLVLPAVLMIKLDTWFPVVSTLLWQYGKTLPMIIELTYGEKGRQMAMQPRPRLEKSLRYTIGLLLVVPAQAVLTTALAGPVFFAACLLLIMAAIPLRFTQWYWVYGAAKDWKVCTAPFWIILSPLWLLVMLLAFPIAIVATFCCTFGYMLIWPFGVMLNDGNLFPAWAVVRKAFGEILSKVHDHTLGEKGHARVVGPRKLEDLHLWWLPSLPFLILGGFFVWFVALLLLLLVRFLPFFVHHMRHIWGAWYDEAGFARKVRGDARLSAACKRLWWLILGIPMLLYSLAFLIFEIPVGLVVVLFVAFFFGGLCTTCAGCYNELNFKEEYDDFYDFYLWTNEHYCCNKTLEVHKGCLPSPDSLGAWAV